MPAARAPPVAPVVVRCAGPHIAQGTVRQYAAPWSPALGAPIFTYTCPAPLVAASVIPKATAWRFRCVRVSAVVIVK